MRGLLMISMTQTDKITTWGNRILDTASTQPSYGFYSANIWLMILPPCGHHTATIEAVSVEHFIAQYHQKCCISVLYRLGKSKFPEGELYNLVYFLNSYTLPNRWKGCLIVILIRWVYSQLTLTSHLNSTKSLSDQGTWVTTILTTILVK